LNSKFILLLGAISSFLVVFFCLKEQYLPRNKVINTLPKQEANKTIKHKKTNIVYTSPKVDHSDKKKLIATLNPDDNISNTTDINNSDIDIKTNLTPAVQKQNNTKTTENETKLIQENINNILKNKPIYFEFGSDKISSSGKEALDNILALIKNSNKRYNVTIEGHTNAVGKESYNKVLSQKRAEAVKKYIIKNSKNIQNISAVGYGSQKPITKDPKDKQNRRVNIKIQEVKND